MSLIASIQLIETASQFTRTGLLISLMILFLTILYSKRFYSPTLIRGALAIVCAAAAFAGITIATSNKITWVCFTGVAFWAVYFGTPKYVDEETKEQAGSDLKSSAGL